MKFKYLVLPLVVAHAAPGFAEESRPNVLLIVADDMGYSDIGPFGGEIETPVLDALATDGLRLTNFHVLASCSPSRSVLMSGMDNHRAGMGTMSEMMSDEIRGLPGYEGHLSHRVAALPEVLNANGYKTYMVGKWHLGEEPEDLPSERGFDDTFVLVDGGGSHWADQKWVTPTVPMHYARNGVAVPDLPEDFYSTRNYTDELIGWIERDTDSTDPFFAFLSYTAPHDPLHAPESYIAKYDGVYDEGWDKLRDMRLSNLQGLGIMPADIVPFPRLPSVKAWSEMTSEEREIAARDMEVYAAMVDYMDAQIGRVVASLKEAGKYDNTLILFMSDNGANGSHLDDYPGQTPEYMAGFDNSLENRGLPGSLIDMGPGWAQASMAPSRMFKGNKAEGGIRSPLVVKLPADMPAETGMNGSFLHIRDIMPTILDVAGIDVPVEEFGGREILPVQGSSVLPLLMGEIAKTGPETTEVGYELFGQKAYFKAPWKALWVPKPIGSGEWELYNIESDPGEMQNLAKEHPELLSELVALWEQYSIENNVLDLTSKNAK